MKGWKSWPPHHPNRSVIARLRPTPSTPRHPLQWCPCQLWLHSLAIAVVLNRFVWLHLKVLTYRCMKYILPLLTHCVSSSACVFQWAMDLLPPDTSQVSLQQRTAERRQQLLYHCKHGRTILRSFLFVYFFTYYFPSHGRWMGSPCTSLSLGISWSQWMHALGKSPRKPSIASWIPRWNCTWKLEYQRGE